jgi:hypothetical protein
MAPLLGEAILYIEKLGKIFKITLLQYINNIDVLLKV